MASNDVADVGGVGDVPSDCASDVTDVAGVVDSGFEACVLSKLHVTSMAAIATVNTSVLNENQTCDMQSSIVPGHDK